VILGASILALSIAGFVQAVDVSAAEANRISTVARGGLGTLD
jgi:hypothetical protein